MLKCGCECNYRVHAGDVMPAPRWWRPAGSLAATWCLSLSEGWDILVYGFIEKNTQKTRWKSVVAALMMDTGKHLYNSSTLCDLLESDHTPVTWLIALIVLWPTKNPSASARPLSLSYHPCELLFLQFCLHSAFILVVAARVNISKQSNWFILWRHTALWIHGDIENALFYKLCEL